MPLTIDPVDESNGRIVIPEIASAPVEPSVRKTDAYGVFCGTINQAVLARILEHLLESTGPSSTVGHLHLIFQSGGGTVADCVCLYNLLRALPLDVTLYNVGSIQSGAVTAYLGAKHRKTSAHAQFMLHRAHCTAQFANAGVLESTVDSMKLDDARTEAIVRARTRLPEEIWTKIKERDVFLSGTEAVQYGIADEIAEFAPPAGTRVHYVY